MPRRPSHGRDDAQLDNLGLLALLGGEAIEQPRLLPQHRRIEGVGIQGADHSAASERPAVSAGLSGFTAGAFLMSARSTTTSRPSSSRATMPAASSYLPATSTASGRRPSSWRSSEAEMFEFAAVAVVAAAWASARSWCCWAWAVLSTFTGWKSPPRAGGAAPTSL
jgi:hypothetical protein